MKLALFACDGPNCAVRKDDVKAFPLQLVARSKGSGTKMRQNVKVFCSPECLTKAVVGK